MKLNSILLEKHQIIHDFAVENHRAANCKYAGYDYDLHLNAVVNVVKQYLYLLSEEDYLPVLASASLHDGIEDTNLSYNDIVVECNKYTDGKLVADIVYNVTNELGRNRKERASKTYPKIASCRLSTFVKLCDRISNFRFSYFIVDEKNMFQLYKKENPDFYKNLHNENHGFDDMWNELNKLAAY